MVGAGLLIYVLLVLVFFSVLYVVVRNAVRAALLDKWKTVRWFELTGEWHDGAWQRRAPRDASEGPIVKIKQK
jgi:hypothetical protein